MYIQLKEIFIYTNISLYSVNFSILFISFKKQWSSQLINLIL